ncbi:MAG: hypothetical protein IT269_04740 [Saprospiraceae bacterium]|nr:hypothetical protein [Saprospiraceae bacterium]
MFKRNEIWVGLLMGLLIPVTAYFLLNAIFDVLEMKNIASEEGLSANFRERTLAIVAIALNLWIMSAYRRRRWENAMRGVVIATSVLALVWVFKYGLTLF